MSKNLLLLNANAFNSPPTIYWIVGIATEFIANSYCWIEKKNYAWDKVTIIICEKVCVELPNIGWQTLTEEYKEIQSKKWKHNNQARQQQSTDDNRMRMNESEW